MPSDSFSGFLRPYALQTWILEDLAQGLEQALPSVLRLQPAQLSQVSLRRSLMQHAGQARGQARVQPLAQFTLQYHCGLPHRLAALARSEGIPPESWAPGSWAPGGWAPGSWAPQTITPLTLARWVLPHFPDRGWRIHIDDRHHWVWTATPLVLDRWLRSWFQHPPARSPGHSVPAPELPLPWAGDDQLLWRSQYHHGRCCQRLQQVAVELGQAGRVDLLQWLQEIVASGELWPSGLESGAVRAKPWQGVSLLGDSFDPLPPSQSQLWDCSWQLLDALAWKPRRSPALLALFLNRLDRFQAAHPFPGFLQVSPPGPPLLSVARYGALLHSSQILLRLVLADLGGAIAPLDL